MMPIGVIVAISNHASDSSLPLQYTIPKIKTLGEFRRGKILTCDRKPEVDLEKKSSEPGDLEKVT